MALDPQQTDIVKNFLWRVYQNDLDGLKALQLEVFQSATDEVLLTSTSSEGGHDSGEKKFDKMHILAAIDELFALLDPTWAPIPSAPRVVGPDFSYSRSV